MSSLTGAEKLILEKVLPMGEGYVMDFSDASFGQFFNDYNVDISDARYQLYGTSKANNMRAFWDIDTDEIVERVLSALLDVSEVSYYAGGDERDSILLAKGREIVDRLSGISPKAELCNKWGNSAQRV